MSSKQGLLWICCFFFFAFFFAGRRGGAGNNTGGVGGVGERGLGGELGFVYICWSRCTVVSTTRRDRLLVGSLFSEKGRKRGVLFFTPPPPRYLIRLLHHGRGCWEESV